MANTAPPPPSGYDDAPYDDDDLINDYMEEDDFGPPADYDDDFLEEMMGDQGQGQTQVQTQVEETVQNKNVAQSSNDVENRIGSNVKDSFENIIANNRKNQDSDLTIQDLVPNEVTIDTAVNHLEKEENNLSSIRKDRDSQLYSFKRYSDTFEWRKRSAQSKREEEDVMAATTWKSKINNNDDKMKMNGKGRNSISNAPESQLVKFVSQVIKGNSESSFLSSSSKDRFRVVSNLPVENEQSVSMTIEGGRMLYIPQAQNDTKYLRCDDIDLTKGANTGLLGIPISEIMKRAEVIERRNDRRKKLRRDRNSNGTTRISTDRDKGNSEGIEEEEKKDYEEDDEFGTNSSSQNRKKIDKKSQLWVDKHAPMTFSDLLSDERTNREVLRALRQWDPFVFHKDPPPRPQVNTYDNDNGANPNPGTLNDKGSLSTPNDDLRPDEQNRVILLSGAPGVGKTTLAHIVARHAGYRPLEINASDERSASVLTERVKRAMESATLNLKQLSGVRDEMAGRPNCLILDEVDGADAKGSISALVDIIRAEKPSKGSRKKGQKTYVRRPIIFICNHKYAPALRSLLPYARQFDVLSPSPNRLVSRLKAVLGAEGMTLVSGSSLLRQLVAASGGDIRSCLYTLQFASARAKEIFFKKKKRDGIVQDFHNSVIDISPVLNVALNGNSRGMKDIRSDITGTLRTIFRKLKSKKIGGSSSLSSPRDVERVLKTVETFNDSSKTLDGLFLNLLNVSYIDPTLDRCWTAHEWLSSSDIYRSHKTSVASTNHSEHRVIQNFHIPSAAAAVHVLCRVETSPDLTFSLKPLSDSIYQLEANSGLINKFLEGLCPKSRSGVSICGFTSEVLPYCLRLLSAGMGSGALNRDVSTVDILTKEERLAFDAHVEMLRVLGLTYKKVEDSHTQGLTRPNESEMILEPEIDQIIQFQSLKMSGRRSNKIPPVLKELLAHATNVANIKHRENQLGLTKEAKDTNKLPQKDKEVKTPKLKPTLAIQQEEVKKDKIISTDELLQNVKKNETKATLNFLGVGAAKAKALRSKRKAAGVGFDRTKKKIKCSNTGSGVPMDEVIRFKYQKGFTQAVRLPSSKDDFTIL